MTQRFTDRRILITQADRFMGPAAVEGFEREGATVLADTGALDSEAACCALIEQAGVLDGLIINLAGGEEGFGRPFAEIASADFETTHRALVAPLVSLCRAALPGMLARDYGRIVVFGSAAGLRGIRNSSAYCSARAAQIGFVRALGVELARSGVQIALIAQNYVDNADYFPADLQAGDRFQAHLKAQVPAGRLGSAAEDIALAMFLASDACGFMPGQIVPLTGGWVA